jgi:hypothetical protein
MPAMMPTTTLAMVGGTAHKNPYHIGGRFGDFVDRGSCDENCPSKPDGPDTRNAIWVRNNLESLKLSPRSDPNAEVFSLHAILDKSRRQVLGSAIEEKPRQHEHAITGHGKKLRLLPLTH